MPNNSRLSRDDAIKAIEAVHRALDEGYASEKQRGQSGVITAVSVAARYLGIPRPTLLSRVGTPSEKGILFRLFGLEVDWTRGGKTAVTEIEPTAPRDPIEVQRLRDELQGERTRRKEAERRTADAEARERSVLGLTATPLQPKLITPHSTESHGSGRSVILHLSDVHHGENVLLTEMDGLNKFNPEISSKRLGRFFTRACDLMTEHWLGDPPEEIILCLGGDLISGSIHNELERTDFPTVPQTIRDVGELLAGGIKLLSERVGRPIRVKSVPGNHGRSTMKPQSKRRASSSFDLLATDFCEAAVKGAALKNVTFYRTDSPDAYFSIYGWHWLLTHGDTMGGKGGGTGYIGPMATIVKGHRKLVDTSWRSGRAVHFVLTAHHHTSGKTSFGWANGSVIGYNEFARDLRADPEPARQNMLVVHPRHGVIAEMPIYLGTSDEGSLYGGPATVIRPEWGEEEPSHETGHPSA